MPKTIDYPRTSYLSAWEVAEVVDDTGGKCSIEGCARKLNRKVSGSFKAILGSAVKFGLLTSKRELLTTTNLFRRIKNAYDKAEEKIYHREAFLHPPLFAHICRKFRNRELPVHMFDVMLIREFGVEEINAQNVAKAFVEGARMVDVLDERNVIADIDQLNRPSPRRELASPEMGLNMFATDGSRAAGPPAAPVAPAPMVAPVELPAVSDDAVASLFGFPGSNPNPGINPQTADIPQPASIPAPGPVDIPRVAPVAAEPRPAASGVVLASTSPDIPRPSPVAGEHSPTPTAYDAAALYTIRITGPGLDTQLSIQDETDLAIVQALLDKIRRRVQ